MRRYYQDFVEHCLKMATRYLAAKEPTQQEWHNRVNEWLNGLPESDRRLIIDVFGKRGERNVRVGLSHSTQQRLDLLEQDFAINSQLTSEKHNKED